MATPFSAGDFDILPLREKWKHDLVKELIEILPERLSPAQHFGHRLCFIDGQLGPFLNRASVDLAKRQLLIILGARNGTQRERHQCACDRK